MAVRLWVSPESHLDKVKVSVLPVRDAGRRRHTGGMRGGCSAIIICICVDNAVLLWPTLTLLMAKARRAGRLPAGHIILNPSSYSAASEQKLFVHQKTQ